MPSHEGCAKAKAILIAPDPVPNSAKTKFLELFSKILRIMSIISSVSGLGISTFSETLNLRSLQKVNPDRY